MRKNINPPFHVSNPSLYNVGHEVNYFYKDGTVKISLILQMIVKKKSIQFTWIHCFNHFLFTI